MWDDVTPLIELWDEPAFNFLAGFQKVLAVFYYAVVSRVRYQSAVSLCKGCAQPKTPPPVWPDKYNTGRMKKGDETFCLVVG